MANRLHVENKGSTAIEFALVAPIFIFIVLALLEIGLVFFAYIQLQHAATDLTKSIRQGSYVGMTNPQARSAMKQLVADRTVGVLSAGPNMDITVLKVTSNSAVDSNTGEICYDPAGTRQAGSSCQNIATGLAYPFRDMNGNGVWDPRPRKLLTPDLSVAEAGDIIQVDIVYRWRIITPLISAIFPNGTLTLGSKVFIRNEVF